ncbi:ribosome biogenesis GTPase YlqF [Dialister micraerophilus]|uniref:Ribosome biogenesis GTPase A n=1 Tax=Dialister micraerophilus UPII 345-E TaxID=910314 RepID=E4LAG1_9FIRM|nr:ribosome biogenesis GTPase YlqF [Dialister micraerophilus]EFR42205.1 ribosome biogenesis GTP-binding protein YlqF [Dialister micraerophilus UPII 345-E]
MLIQWFPGHMAKTKRLITEHLKAVDVAVELLDARIPMSSANPMVENLVQNKPRIIVLNKSDLADVKITEKWIEYFKKENIDVIPVSTYNGKDKKKLINLIREKAKPVLEKWQRRGLKNRSVRIMILGIPNVGKSTLINFLSGSKATRTANTPGHTKGKQWVRLSSGLDLLDTPGVLWPKFEDQNAALKLAATGAIAGEIFDSYEVVTTLLAALKEISPQILKEKYDIEDVNQDTQILLELIGKRRGCLLPGGEIDSTRAEALVLTDFRSGKLGRVTLDVPPSEDKK